MARKGENIRKRADGRWEARYIKSRDLNGRIQYGYLYGRSYREVKEKKLRKLAEHSADFHARNGVFTFHGGVTFETVSELWKQNKRHMVKDSTYANYVSILKRQLLPDFGTAAIKNISNYRIHCFYRQKKLQGLSTGFLRVIFSVLRSVLYFAGSAGARTADSIHFPRLSGSNTAPRLMDEHDYQILHNNLSQPKDSFSFGILLCMHTGLRLGELSGLRWEDIDFQQKTLSVRRTILRIKNLDNLSDPVTGKIPKTIIHIGEPKTSSSKRKIPLPDKLLQIAQQFVRSGESYILTGTPRFMEPRTIQRRYSSLLKAYHISYVKIHTLRHQFSCRWVEQGFDPKSLSEILGHTTVRTTLNLYVHVQLDTKRRYLDELMGLPRSCPQQA